MMHLLNKLQTSLMKRAGGRFAFMDYAQRELLPRRPDKRDDSYVPGHEIGACGIDLHVADQLARLQSWQDESHQALFRAIRNDPALNVPCFGRNFRGTDLLHNGWYPTPDAEIYAAMIMDRKPDLIVEVGSGFSTLIARKTIEHCRLQTRLVVIDPQPRTDVRAVVDDAHFCPVEDSPLRTLPLTGRSLLFIDSSHVTRPRGDIPFLFCQVLPTLPTGVTVHVHDIFTPYDYPTVYDGLCYSEQYALQCLLSHSPRYRTLLAAQFLSRQHTEALRAAISPSAAKDPLFFGASYWFDVMA